MGLACRLAVAAAFLMAAVTKITDLETFSDHLILHSGLPFWLAYPVTLILPWLELVLGLALAAGVAVRESTLISAILLAAFLAYLLWHKGEADCRCFLFPTPAQFANAQWWPAARDTALLLAALYVAGKKNCKSCA